MRKKQIVVGFNVNEFNRNYLDSLSNREKHELFLETVSAISYDNPNDFFSELNLDLVDTRHHFWYLIEID